MIAVNTVKKIEKKLDDLANKGFVSSGIDHGFVMQFLAGMSHFSYDPAFFMEDNCDLSNQHVESWRELTRDPAQLKKVELGANTLRLSIALNTGKGRVNAQLMDGIRLGHERIGKKDCFYLGVLYRTVTAGRSPEDEVAIRICTDNLKDFMTLLSLRGYPLSQLQNAQMVRFFKTAS